MMDCVMVCGVGVVVVTLGSFKRTKGWVDFRLSDDGL